MSDNNPQGAKERLEGLKTGSLATTVTASVLWRRPMARCVTALADGKPALSIHDVARLPAYADVFRGDTNVIASPSVDLQATNADLVATHQAFAVARQCFSQVSDALVRFKDTVDPTLQGLSQPSKAEAQHYDAATERLLQTLNDPARALADHDIDILDQCVSGQRNAWKEVATLHLAPKSVAECAVLIDAGRWEEALQKLESSQSMGILDASASAPPSTMPGILTGPATNPGPARGSVQGQSWQRTPAILAGTDKERRALRKKMLAAAALQSLLVGIVFFFGAYALNSDTWIGALKDIATLFLMAFGVDLTADGILASVKRS